MKRYFVDAADLDILSDQQFSKRLKLEDYSFLSCNNLKQLLVDDSRILRDVESEEQKDLMHISGALSPYQTTDSLNSTLGKLHQQREGRKLLRRACVTSPISASQKLDREFMVNQDYSFGSPLISVSMSQGNVPSQSWSVNCRKQLQFQRDYEARTELEMCGRTADKGNPESSNLKRAAPDDMLFEPNVQHHHNHNLEERYKQENFLLQQQGQDCTSWKWTPKSSSFAFHEDHRKMDVD